MTCIKPHPCNVFTIATNDTTLFSKGNNLTSRILN